MLQEMVVILFTVVCIDIKPLQISKMWPSPFSSLKNKSMLYSIMLGKIENHNLKLTIAFFHKNMATTWYHQYKLSAALFRVDSISRGPFRKHY